MDYRSQIVPIIETIRPWFLIGFGVFVLVVVIGTLKTVYTIYSDTPEEKQRKKKLQEEDERQGRGVEEIGREIYKSTIIRDQMTQYRQLRKEIESMPAYENWKQRVFEKFGGRRCMKCGSTENIEVDHRYKSFYSIINKYGIINKDQAYECVELWDIENGAPLCKKCHDKTKSSMLFNKINQ